MIFNRVTKASWYSIALMVLTSIHHVYGAFRYHTPWRLHVLLLSIPVIILTIVIDRVVRRRAKISAFVFWAFFTITLVPSISLIGFYEGIYNHILKNILFYGGADINVLHTLFPPPKYEMPNDVWFEITGVLQGILVVPLTIQLIRLTASFFNLKLIK